MSKAQYRQIWDLNEPNGQHSVTNADSRRSHSNPRHWASIAYAAFDCAPFDGSIIADRASQALGSELRGIGSTSEGSSTDTLERYGATRMKNTLAVIYQLGEYRSLVVLHDRRPARRCCIFVHTRTAYDVRMYASTSSDICRILSPELRNGILQWGVFHRDLPPRLVFLQFVQPGRHVR
jgi:hypothetical protein